MKNRVRRLAVCGSLAVAGVGIGAVADVVAPATVEAAYCVKHTGYMYAYAYSPNGGSCRIAAVGTNGVVYYGPTGRNGAFSWVFPNVPIVWTFIA